MSRRTTGTIATAVTRSSYTLLLNGFNQTEIVCFDKTIRFGNGLASFVITDRRKFTIDAELLEHIAFITDDEQFAVRPIVS